MCHVDGNASPTVLFGRADSRLANIWKEAGVFTSQQPLNWQHTVFLGNQESNLRNPAGICYALLQTRISSEVYSPSSC